MARHSSRPGVMGGGCCDGREDSKSWRWPAEGSFPAPIADPVEGGQVRPAWGRPVRRKDVRGRVPRHVRRMTHFSLGQLPPHMRAQAEAQIALQPPKKRKCLPSYKGPSNATGKLLWQM